MARWAIGDIQGCADSFFALLQKINFKKSRDRLYLLGDLVNRGPKSKKVIDWVIENRDATKTVLGNHDLHLLACLAGVIKPRSRDTLDPFFNAKSKEKERWIGWLRTRPLLRKTEGYLFVHAGIYPTWSIADAFDYASEVERALTSEKWEQYLRAWRGDRQARPKNWAKEWSDTLKGKERIVTLLEIFTRMRVIDEKGHLDMEYNGPASQVPEGLLPWHALLKKERKKHIVYGHWAAQGFRQTANWTALDSGCVWGGKLSAMDLDTKEIIQIASLER